MNVPYPLWRHQEKIFCYNSSVYRLTWFRHSTFGWKKNRIFNNSRKSFNRNLYIFGILKRKLKNKEQIKTQSIEQYSSQCLDSTNIRHSERRGIVECCKMASEPQQKQTNNTPSRPTKNYYTDLSTCLELYNTLNAKISQLLFSSWHLKNHKD